MTASGLGPRKSVDHNNVAFMASDTCSLNLILRLIGSGPELEDSGRVEDGGRGEDGGRVEDSGEENNSRAEGSGQRPGECRGDVRAGAGGQWPARY